MSYLAEDESLSLLWRENFLNSFMERDIPAHGFNISSGLLRHLLAMLAHSSGQVINKSGLSNARCHPLPNSGQVFTMGLSL
jgi:predicted AAA+ superfamily ATPase